MENLDKLYDAFGELVYVVAMADGIIQDEEYEALEKILKGHPWAKEIKWSFDYEREHQNPVDILYKRVIDICYESGPREEYQYLLEMLNTVAASSNGIDENESRIINKFTSELTNRFKSDLDKMSK